MGGAHLRRRFADPSDKLQSPMRDSTTRRRLTKSQGGTVPMQMSSAIPVALLALIAFAGTSLSSACRADEGFVPLVIYKAGCVNGGSGRGGALTFHSRSS